MSWKQKQNINRIFNAFKRNKAKIYESEIQALSDLNDYIEEQTSKFVHGNLLAAKLATILILGNVRYYGDIKTSLDSLKSALKQDLNFHLECLRLVLNENELINWLKSEGVNFDQIESFDINSTNVSEKEFIEKLQKSWSFENVQKSLFSTVNDLIKDINNYK